MEFGPILRSLLHNRARFVLITLEVALTLAIVVNCSAMILDLRAMMFRDSGMDEENILMLRVRPFAPALVDEESGRAQMEEDLRILENLPGVRRAISISSVPLSGGGSATGRRQEGSDVSYTLPYFNVSPGATEALGVEILAGRALTPEDFLTEENTNILVNQTMADLLFPDGDALGKIIHDRGNGERNRIVGITGPMLNSWPSSEVGDRVALFPRSPFNPGRLQYLVRVEPGSMERLYQEAVETLLTKRQGRLVDAVTLGEVRARNFQSDQAVATILSIVIGLLIFVTALGIVGVTSFSVTQRTRQIGTRRALGASRGAILRYFLLENWLVTSLGLALGLLLTFGLSYVLVHYTGAVRPSWSMVAAGLVFLWGTGLLAAWLPARRGMRVAPVVATRGL